MTTFQSAANYRMQISNKQFLNLSQLQDLEGIEAKAAIGLRKLFETNSFINFEATFRALPHDTKKYIYSLLKDDTPPNVITILSIKNATKSFQDKFNKKMAELANPSETNSTNYFLKEDSWLGESTLKAALIGKRIRNWSSLSQQEANLLMVLINNNNSKRARRHRRVLNAGITAKTNCKTCIDSPTKDSSPKKAMVDDGFMDKNGRLLSSPELWREPLHKMMLKSLDSEKISDLPKVVWVKPGINSKYPEYWDNIRQVNVKINIENGFLEARRALNGRYYVAQTGKWLEVLAFDEVVFSKPGQLAKNQPQINVNNRNNDGRLRSIPKKEPTNNQPTTESASVEYLLAEKNISALDKAKLLINKAVNGENQQLTPSEIKITINNPEDLLKLNSDSTTIELIPNWHKTVNPEAVTNQLAQSTLTAANPNIATNINTAVTITPQDSANDQHNFNIDNSGKPVLDNNWSAHYDVILTDGQAITASLAKTDPRFKHLDTKHLTLKHETQAPLTIDPSTNILSLTNTWTNSIEPNVPFLLAIEEPTIQHTNSADVEKKVKELVKTFKKDDTFFDKHTVNWPEDRTTLLKVDDQGKLALADDWDSVDNPIPIPKKAPANLQSTKKTNTGQPSNNSPISIKPKKATPDSIEPEISTEITYLPNNHWMGNTYTSSRLNSYLDDLEGKGKLLALAKQLIAKKLKSDLPADQINIQILNNNEKFPREIFIAKNGQVDLVDDWILHVQGSSEENTLLFELLGENLSCPEKCNIVGIQNLPNGYEEGLMLNDDKKLILRDNKITMIVPDNSLIINDKLDPDEKPDPNMTVIYFNELESNLLALIKQEINHPDLPTEGISPKDTKDLRVTTKNGKLVLKNDWENGIISNVPILLYLDPEKIEHTDTKAIQEKIKELVLQETDDINFINNNHFSWPTTAKKMIALLKVDTNSGKLKLVDGWRITLNVTKKKTAKEIAKPLISNELKNPDELDIVLKDSSNNYEQLLNRSTDPIRLAADWKTKTAYKAVYEKKNTGDPKKTVYFNNHPESANDLTGNEYTDRTEYEYGINKTATISDTVDDRVKTAFDWRYGTLEINTDVFSIDPNINLAAPNRFRLAGMNLKTPTDFSPDLIWQAMDIGNDPNDPDIVTITITTLGTQDTPSETLTYNLTRTEAPKSSELDTVIDTAKNDIESAKKLFADFYLVKDDEDDNNQTRNTNLKTLHESYKQLLPKLRDHLSKINNITPDPAEQSKKEEQIAELKSLIIADPTENSENTWSHREFETADKGRIVIYKKTGETEPIRFLYISEAGSRILKRTGVTIDFSVENPSLTNINKDAFNISFKANPIGTTESNSWKETNFSNNLFRQGDSTYLSIWATSTSAKLSILDAKKEADDATTESLIYSGFLSSLVQELALRPIPDPNIIYLADIKPETVQAALIEGQTTKARDIQIPVTISTETAISESIKFTTTASSINFETPTLSAPPKETEIPDSIKGLIDEENTSWYRANIADSNEYVLIPVNTEGKTINPAAIIYNIEEPSIESPTNDFIGSELDPLINKVISPKTSQDDALEIHSTALKLINDQSLPDKTKKLLRNSVSMSYLSKTIDTISSKETDIADAKEILYSAIDTVNSMASDTLNDADKADFKGRLVTAYLSRVIPPKDQKSFDLNEAFRKKAIDRLLTEHNYTKLEEYSVNLKGSGSGETLQPYELLELEYIQFTGTNKNPIMLGRNWRTAIDDPITRVDDALSNLDPEQKYAKLQELAKDSLVATVKSAHQNLGIPDNVDFKRTASLEKSTDMYQRTMQILLDTEATLKNLQLRDDWNTNITWSRAFYSDNGAHTLLHTDGKQVVIREEALAFLNKEGNNISAMGFTPGPEKEQREQIVFADPKLFTIKKDNEIINPDGKTFNLFTAINDTKNVTISLEAGTPDKPEHLKVILTKADSSSITITIEANNIDKTMHHFDATLTSLQQDLRPHMEAFKKKGTIPEPKVLGQLQKQLETATALFYTLDNIPSGQLTEQLTKQYAQLEPIYLRVKNDLTFLTEYDKAKKLVDRIKPILQETEKLINTNPTQARTKLKEIKQQDLTGLTKALSELGSLTENYYTDPDDMSLKLKLKPLVRMNIKTRYIKASATIAANLKSSRQKNGTTSETRKLTTHEITRITDTALNYASNISPNSNSEEAKLLTMHLKASNQQRLARDLNTFLKAQTIASANFGSLVSNLQKFIELKDNFKEAVALIIAWKLFRLEQNSGNLNEPKNLKPKLNRLENLITTTNKYKFKVLADEFNNM